MANDTAQPGKPTVIYSPLRLNWKNVVAGTVIALLMVAIGVFAFSYYNPDATPVPPVVIKSGTKSAKVATKSATPSTQKDETAGWKTYTNSTYDFSFKYPTEWSIKEETKDSITLSSDNPNIEFVMYKSDIIIEGIKPYKITSSEKVRVIDKDVEKNLLEDDPSVFPTAPRPIRNRGAFVQIEKGENRFVISVFYEKNNQSVVQLFDSVIKTLKLSVN